MLDNYLDEYVDEMMARQNEGADVNQQNLFSRKDYYEIYKPVVDAVKAYGSDNIDEIRERLYESSGLAESVRHFVYDREMTPGMVFSFGTMNYRETVVVGNRQEVTIDRLGNVVPAVEKMTEKTIFDLASITKIFTSLSVLRLLKEKKIKLSDPVKKYVPEFENLEGVTIFDLLSFNVPLRTTPRIEDAKDREEAENIFRGMYIDESKIGSTTNPYTDLGAMVLKCVIEKVSGEDFYNYVYDTILDPLGMVDSHALVPNYKLSRVANTSFETRFLKDGSIINLPIKDLGVVNDNKALVLGQQEGVLSGHAGMFAPIKDLTNLARGIIGGDVLPREYIDMISTNRTGGRTVQYLGFLAYCKNPSQEDSEVYHALSGRTFANGGFTGNQLTIDPRNELYFALAANRTHNRVSIVDKPVRDQINYDENKKGTIVLPNGTVKSVSYAYAWDRDAAVVHRAIRLDMQYKMLEDICKLYNNGIVDQIEHTRHL